MGRSVQPRLITETSPAYGGVVDLGYNANIVCSLALPEFLPDENENLIKTKSGGTLFLYQIIVRRTIRSSSHRPSP